MPAPLPRYPLRINVGFLLNQPVGTSRDIHFDYPEIRLSPDFTVTGFQGVTRISRTPQGLLFQCKFSGVQKAECVRCLDEYDQVLETEFDELFTFRFYPAAENAQVIPEDGNVDLAPLAREYLLIELPIKPLCRPDCRGLCVECGENLNRAVCEHHPAIEPGP